MPDKFAKIVIIGGGPVGLTTGILLKRKHAKFFSYEKNSLSVTIIEKRPAYTREQLILLNEDSLKLLPFEVIDRILLESRDKKMGCFIIGPNRKGKAICFDKPYMNLESALASVQINILEKELVKVAKKEGIKIIRPKKSKELTLTFKDNYVRTNEGQKITFDVLVGADGYNSQVRTDVLKCKTVPFLKKKIGWTIIILLHNTGSEFKLNKDKPTRRDFEDSSKLRSDFSRVMRTSKGDMVYLAYTIPEVLAMKIKKTKILPEYFSKIIKQICKTIKTKCSIKDMKGFTVLPMNPQISECFAGWTKGKKKRPVYLVGDAYVNTHFFTGSGFNTGIKFADIVSSWIGDPFITDKDFKEWHNRLQKELLQKSYKRVLDVSDPKGEWSKYIVASTKKEFKCKGWKNDYIEDIMKTFGIDEKRITKQEKCFVFNNLELTKDWSKALPL